MPYSVTGLDLIPETYPAPTLPGAAGGTFVEPEFGRRVMQVTANASGGVSMHSYSSRSPFSRNSTRVLFKTEGTGWLVRAVDPAAFSLGAQMSNLGAAVYQDPLLWDWSGDHETRLYGAWHGIGSDPEADGYRQFVYLDADTYSGVGSAVLLKDFSSNLRLDGVVTSGSNNTTFVHNAGAPTSPITDFATHWFTGQKIRFATDTTTVALRGQRYTISSYDAGTRTIVTTGAMAATPASGDTFYVYPAGYGLHFAASTDGVWVATAISEPAGAGGDIAHTLVAYNRVTDTVYVRRASKAEFAGVDTGGVHRMGFERGTGLATPRVFISIFSPAKSAVWDIVAGTIESDSDNLGHEDETYDGRALSGQTGQTLAYDLADIAAAPAVAFDPPKKDSKYMYATTAHVGCAAEDTALLSTYVSYGAWPAGWANVTGAVYVYSGGFLARDARAIHATPANLGEARYKGTRLTYMGTTSGAIVGAGQWAYDPAGNSGNGTLWVRTQDDADLTSGANNQWLDVFDWRWGQQEIWLAHIGNPAVVDSFTRACKTYSWINPTGSGAASSATVAGPRAAPNRDGTLVMWTSTWGPRDVVDVFIAEIIPEEPAPVGQLEEALYARLSGYASLTALVGARIYPLRAPQTAPLPYVVYQRISTIRWSAMGVDTGLARPRMQLTAWASTPAAAKAVKEQVRAALQRWRGTAANVTILDSFLADERDLVDEEQQEAGRGEAGAYGASLDVLIPHRES
jgi:hypothetical protein